jgi:hypothetical protein
LFKGVRGDRSTTKYGCHTSILVWIKFICLPNGSISDVDEHKSNDLSTNVVSHVISYGRGSMATNVRTLLICLDSLRDTISMSDEKLFYKIIFIAHLQIWDKVFVSDIELEE